MGMEMRAIVLRADSIKRREDAYMLMFPDDVILAI